MIATPRNVAALLLLAAAACGSVQPDDLLDAGATDPITPDADGSPPLPLELTGDAIDFVGVAVGERSVAIALTVQNPGDASVGPLTVAYGGDRGDFAIDDGCAGLVVAPAAACRITVVFAPVGSGARAATLEVRAPAFQGALHASLLGRGLVGALSVYPTRHDFGAADLAATTAPTRFDVTSIGQVAADALNLTLGQASGFQIVDDGCSGIALAPGARCTFAVRFAPLAAGPAVSSIEIDGGVVGATAASVGGRGQAVIAVTRNGTGSGAVASVPAGLDCGPTCSARFETSPVRLTATPAAGHGLVRWGGACAGAGACIVSLSAATTAVTATFEPLRTLTVAPAGGSVHVEPGAADCAAEACAYSLPRTTSVTVRADPPPGQAFAGWTGGPAACVARMTCTFALNVDITMTARWCAEDDACCLAPVPECL